MADRITSPDGTNTAIADNDEIVLQTNSGTEDNSSKIRVAHLTNVNNRPGNSIIEMTTDSEPSNGAIHPNANFSMSSTNSNQFSTLSMSVNRPNGINGYANSLMIMHHNGTEISNIDAPTGRDSTEATRLRAEHNRISINKQIQNGPYLPFIATEDDDIATKKYVDDNSGLPDADHLRNLTLSAFFGTHGTCIQFADRDRGIITLGPIGEPDVRYTEATTRLSGIGTQYLHAESSGVRIPITNLTTGQNGTDAVLTLDISNVPVLELVQFFRRSQPITFHL